MLRQKSGKGGEEGSSYVPPIWYWHLTHRLSTLVISLYADGNQNPLRSATTVSLTPA